jgi:hypothetical protein
MAEYLANAVQRVALNEPIIFSASIPCTRGYVYHEDETGIFTLRGITANTCNMFARYQLTFNGNIALPEDGTTVGPIAIGIAVNGEPRQTSRAIYVPAAVSEYGNVTSTCIVTVPRGCCFSASVRSVSGVDDGATVPAPAIEVQNANLTITRIA